MFWQFGRTRLRHLVRCLMLFSMLFILVGAGRIQAQAAGAAEYPAWVRQAVVGTAYTADEFVGLPFEQQLQIVQTLHPEIDPTALTISTAAAEPNSLIQANTANMTVNPLAAGNTLLDIAPSDNNKAFAYFNIGTPSTQTVPSGVPLMVWRQVVRRQYMLMAVPYQRCVFYQVRQRQLILAP